MRSLSNNALVSGDTIIRWLVTGPMKRLGTLDMQLDGHSGFLFESTCPKRSALCISVRDLLLDSIGAIIRSKPRPSMSK